MSGATISRMRTRCSRAGARVVGTVSGRSKSKPVLSSTSSNVWPGWRLSSAKRAPARGVAAPFSVEKTLERRAKRGVLQLADRLMVDARRAADRRQRVAIALRERSFAAERREFRNVRDPDENRVDRHRADRRVRRLLAGRHLVERQQLQHALSRAFALSQASPAKATAPGTWS